MTTVAMLLGWAFLAFSALALCGARLGDVVQPNAWRLDCLACGWAIAAALMWMVAR